MCESLQKEFAMIAIMNTNAPATHSLAQASSYWFKLGLISFGGPAGQISIMHQDLVEKRHWISERRFMHALNYCMVLPGPEAQQLATYIGWLMHGVRGAVVAGGLFVLPSLLVLIGLSWLYMSLGAQITTQALYGIKPAVIAVVAFAAWRIGKKVLKQKELWLIAAAAFLAVLLLKLPFPLIVATAGVLGWILRARLRTRSGHIANSVQQSVPAMIDDSTPIPAHARYSKASLFKVLFGGISLWGAGFLITYSMDPTLTQMAAFFSKAALVTFGGAYAVMPYVFQATVEHYQWLTPAQMLDGLALGETTPGPLIMVVAFVGFVGAWSKAALLSPAAAGVLGACVATYFTFLPSFVFILAGGPLVEHTREDFKLAGPLAAITAAVVGAILYLAVFLAWHLLWPLGWSAMPDWFAMVLAVVAWWVLYREKLGMIPVIVLSGLAGALWRYLL